MAQDLSKKRLGRGLAALIGELDLPAAAARPASDNRADRKAPIEKIRANPANPRRHFAENELTDLAASIARHGIVQPILVRPIHGKDLGGAQFEIIAGERRWRAAQKAGLHEVPVIVRDVADKQALELAIIENVQRADLNPLEEAAGYQQLIDEYEYSQADLGGIIGKSRSHVANTLRLAKLPEPVKRLLAQGALSAGHARALVTAKNPEALAARIVEQGLSVRQAEALAQGAATGASGGAARKATAKDADTAALEKRVSDALGLKVAIRFDKKGEGDIRIRYKNVEQLDTVCRRLEHRR